MVETNMRLRSPTVLLVFLLCPLLSGLWGVPPKSALAQVEIDPNLPDYEPVSGIAGGSIKTVGSDTMNNLVGLWAEEFKKFYPGVKPEVDGKGSSNAIPALASGQAGFGPMSREPKKSEIESFRNRFQYEPTILPTSIDLLAVYVNRDNPIESMSFQDLDAIFSSTRKVGASSRATRWSAFIDQGPIARQSITCYGRNAASGTYGYFKEVVLGDGDYGNWVNELPGSSAVVQSVGKNLNGIGYSGLGYRTADVKVLSLSASAGEEPVAAIPENAYSGEYPLARYLYLAINYDQRTGLDPLRREFLKYVFSKQGQRQVVKDGYLPISAELASEVLQSVGIEVQ
jgi:phosphate transport system substrate-binding protein